MKLIRVIGLTCIFSMCQSGCALFQFGGGESSKESREVSSKETETHKETIEISTSKPRPELSLEQVELERKINEGTAKMAVLVDDKGTSPKTSLTRSLRTLTDAIHRKTGTPLKSYRTIPPDPTKAAEDARKLLGMEREYRKSVEDYRKTKRELALIKKTVDNLKKTVNEKNTIINKQNGMISNLRGMVGKFGNGIKGIIALALIVLGGVLSVKAYLLDHNTTRAVLTGTATIAALFLWFMFADILITIAFIGGAIVLIVLGIMVIRGTFVAKWWDDQMAAIKIWFGEHRTTSEGKKLRRVLKMNESPHKRGYVAKRTASMPEKSAILSSAMITRTK